MRFNASFPNLSVVLDPGETVVNQAGIVSRRPVVELKFSRGYAETKTPEMTRLAIAFLVRVKKERMRVTFGVDPRDLEEAKELAAELGGELPPYSQTIGRTFAPGARGIAQPMPSDIEGAFQGGSSGAADEAVLAENARLRAENEALKRAPAPAQAPSEPRARSRRA